MSNYARELTDDQLAREVIRAWQGMRYARTDEIHDEWSERYQTLTGEQDERSIDDSVINAANTDEEAEWEQDLVYVDSWED